MDKVTYNVPNGARHSRSSPRMAANVVMLSGHHPELLFRYQHLSHLGVPTQTWFVFFKRKKYSANTTKELSAASQSLGQSKNIWGFGIEGELAVPEQALP
jgi:hypothetical protein